jgi:hypothetical protein
MGSENHQVTHNSGRFQISVHPAIKQEISDLSRVVRVLTRAIHDLTRVIHDLTRAVQVF